MRRVVLIIVIGILLAVVILTLLPQHLRQHTNERLAAATLRRIGTLQHHYASTHPDVGFACDLSRLQASEMDGSFLDSSLTGSRAGYRFAIAGCESRADGVVIHYRATAVPLEQGTTGFLALCTDESGTLWYDKAGSGTDCFTYRRRVVE